MVLQLLTLVLLVMNHDACGRTIIIGSTNSMELERSNSKLDLSKLALLVT